MKAGFCFRSSAAYIWIRGGATAARVGGAAVLRASPALGPLLWLAHNRWYFGDPLYFYRGPWSALAIQGNASYPGQGDWRVAAQYFFDGRQTGGGLPGAAAWGGGRDCRRLRAAAFWPRCPAGTAAAFYIWSIHSSGTPIFVPTLRPHSWYNTRYAMALLPLVALGVAALARFVQDSARRRRGPCRIRARAVSDPSARALRSPGRKRT